MTMTKMNKRSRLTVPLTVIIIISLTLGMFNPAGTAAKVTQDGVISGWVSNLAHDPLENIEVALFCDLHLDDSNVWWFLAYVLTAIDGFYEFTGIPEGNCKVGFSDPAGIYASEYFDDSPTLTNAVPLAITGRATAWTDINAVLMGFGGISGNVSYDDQALSPDFAPVPNTLVVAYLFNGVEMENVSTTTTDGSGDYSLGGLYEGVYNVYFVPPPESGLAPEYYDDMNFIEDSTAVNVTAGIIVTDTNAILDPPPPPLAEVETETGGVTVDPDSGELIVQVPNQDPSDVVVTVVVACAGDLPPTNVTLYVEGDPNSPYTMVETEPGTYQATVDTSALDDDFEGTLSVEWTCDQVQDDLVIGELMLYSPTGVVLEAVTGKPIAGATVTLYKVPGWRPRVFIGDGGPNTCESDASKPGGPWTQEAPTELGEMAMPESGDIVPAVSSQNTDTMGRFGWQVAEGCWYVVVNVPGYRTQVSALVGLPPEITDLIVYMTPNGFVILPTIMKN